jgi:pterin-4a-carbinolamine dehydratase
MNMQNAVNQKAIESTVQLPGEDLKSERVQDGLAAAAPVEAYFGGDSFILPLDPGKLQARLKSERVQELLKALPGWRLQPGGKAINRVKGFPTPEVARQYSGFVASYAGAMGLPVILNVAGGQVVITLHAPRSRGRAGLVTEAVVDFARRLG